MKLTLSHFTENPFVLDPEMKYKNKKIDSFKPVGFWLSDESNYGWSEWCRRSDFAVETLANRTDFICDTSTWLTLKDSSQLNAFTEKYGKSLRDDRPTGLPSIWTFDYIEWEKVQTLYGGILITPYSFEARLNLMWYYGWDCASACVWDLTTITQVRYESS